MMKALRAALDTLIQEISDENTRLPQAAQPFLAGEIRLLDTLRHVVVPDMLGRLT